MATGTGKTSSLFTCVIEGDLERRQANLEYQKHCVEELLREAEVITELTRKCIEENASSAQNQEEFTAKYNGYEQRYEAVRKKVEKLRTQKEERQTQADSISAFMFELHELDEPVTLFDEKLWLSVIDIVTVRHDGTLVFRFRNGMEVES